MWFSFVLYFIFKIQKKKSQDLKKAWQQNAAPFLPANVRGLFSRAHPLLNPPEKGTGPPGRPQGYWKRLRSVLPRLTNHARADSSIIPSSQLPSCLPAPRSSVPKAPRFGLKTRLETEMCLCAHTASWSSPRCQANGRTFNADPKFPLVCR